MGSTAFTHTHYEQLYPEGIEKHYWNSSRNKTINRLLKRYIVSGSEILEIGCGKGIVVNYLRNKGYNVFGVELSMIDPLPDVASYIKSGISAFDLEEEERRRVKIILLLDVIEHIEDPSVFLEEITEKYRNLEKIIITVPARNELFSNYDRFNNHYTRYNKKLLVEVMKKTRLNIEWGRYIYHTLYLPTLLYLKLNKDRPTHIIPPKGKINKCIHQLLCTWFVIESYIVPRSIPGTSIVAVLSTKASC
ncbi:MAG: class I SAM-dependent methyltransferase [Bacteroidales bacterium]|nr:class I SAM-dependent methyltransferase [Bacteroidales bacterium]